MSTGPKGTPPLAMTSAAGELRYEDYLADSHRPGFDGLRGIGLLLVISARIPHLAH